jgi:cell division septation protein DedD
MQNGFVVELAVKKFTFPMYIFNPLNKERSFVVGASFDLNFKKKKTDKPKEEDFLKESFPVRILASGSEDKNFLSEKKLVKIPAKPAAESVIKIRRVNVIVRTKEPNEDSAAKEPVSLTPKSNSVASPVSAPAVKEKRATDTLKSNTAPLKKTSQKVPEREDDTPATERIQAFTSKHTATFYALELGPFKIEDEAKRIQTSLTSIFTRDVILLSDMGLYKLRVTGFTDPEDAEIFKKNAVNEGLKAASSIMPYSLKGIDPLPFRNVEESFKATKL